METSAFLMKRPTPLGEILLSSDGNNLTGLWFTGQKYFATNIGNNPDYNKNLPVFKQANNWLDTYFAKNDPKAINIPLAFHGTDFQKMSGTYYRRFPTVLHAHMAILLTRFMLIEEGKRLLVPLAMLLVKIPSVSSSPVTESSAPMVLLPVTPVVSTKSNIYYD